jgi:hypothetical protein
MIRYGDILTAMQKSSKENLELSLDLGGGKSLSQYWQ